MIAKPRRAKVYAEFDEDDPPTANPPLIEGSENWFNFWAIASIIIGAVGSLLYFSGWLQPPQQATLDKLEQTQQTLLDTKTELQRVKSCVEN